jgi:hypothetical protein
MSPYGCIAVDLQVARSTVPELELPAPPEPLEPEVVGVERRDAVRKDQRSSDLPPEKRRVFEPLLTRGVISNEAKTSPLKS